MNSQTDHDLIGMQKPYNISLYPGTGSADGRRGDHIIVAPAYNITAEEVRYVVDTVVAVINRYFKHHSSDWTGSKVGDREMDLHKPRR